MFVERFQNVTSNQVIAIIVNTDPELIKAQIESIQADIKILAARNAVDEQRTDQAFREFQQDLLKLKVDQASDQIQVDLATREYQRVKAQFDQGSESLANLEAEKAKLDTYTSLLQERGRQIDDLQKSLDALAAKRNPDDGDPFAEGVAKKAAELELMLKPSTLRAPISGMISLVHHVKGERILRGMPIVSINDPETRRIIGYIRQPVVRVPSTNDWVTITTRTQTRQMARGQIVRVGTQLEPINPGLIAADSTRMEVGLPIVVSVPDGIQLVPGEYLNLHIDFHPK
jgi:multidrug resistance efflux pump